MPFTVSFTLAHGVGPDIAASDTITPTNQIHHVTGNTTVHTITTPIGVQPGEMLVLIFDGPGNGLGNKGNINASLSVPTAKTKAILFWDGGKWC